MPSPAAPVLHGDSLTCANTDTDLQHLVNVWENLPAPIRRGMLAMADATLIPNEQA